jgi:hypothetical protein
LDIDISWQRHCFYSFTPFYSVLRWETCGQWPPCLFKLNENSFNQTSNVFKSGFLMTRLNYRETLFTNKRLLFKLTGTCSLFPYMYSVNLKKSSLKLWKKNWLLLDIVHISSSSESWLIFRRFLPIVSQRPLSQVGCKLVIIIINWNLESYTNSGVNIDVHWLSPAFSKKKEGYKNRLCPSACLSERRSNGLWASFHPEF